MFENNDLGLDENLFENLSDENIYFMSNEKRGQEPIAGSSNNLFLQDNRNEISKRKTAKQLALKRKFPGPAGLFPEANEVLNSENKYNQGLFPNTQFLCSQSSNLTFQEATWLDMYKDFKGFALLKKYNIQWMNNNITNTSINRKVPFLVGIIKQIKNTSKSPILVLADQSGEIEALISADLYEDYSEYLINNSVLVLRQCGILSVSSCKHYVNITMDNLIRIYSCKDVSDDYVNIVHIQEVSNVDLESSVNKFIQKYESLQKVTTPNRLVEDIGINSMLYIQSRNQGQLKSVHNVTGNHKVNLLNAHNTNILKENQNFELTCKKGTVVNNATDKTVTNKSETKKFDFKSISHRTADLCNPTKNITSLNIRNIIKQPHNCMDLGIRIDDFQDNFSLQSESYNPSNSYNNNEHKERKVDIIKHTLKNSFDCSKNGVANEPSNNAKTINQQTKIDCSQISIISQHNNENPDIIKDVFSDLDVSVLFDDF